MDHYLIHYIITSPTTTIGLRNCLCLRFSDIQSAMMMMTDSIQNHNDKQTQNLRCQI